MPTDKQIMFEKATEYPNSGEYNHFFEKGVYICKNCQSPLYHSDFKFDSGCGWPAFDDQVFGAIAKVPDGGRTEIICQNCKIHLGHIFEGERMTIKNLRHCVNSASMIFKDNLEFEKIVVAGGCFWGVEYYFKTLKGVISTQVGYIGGPQSTANYQAVCTGNSGHYEGVEILFDPKIVSTRQILKLFFEIHDFSQFSGQGNDLGEQYKSRIFANTNQQIIAKELVELLSQKYTIATQILPISQFFDAENYHQDYYQKTNKTPYCHFKKTIFE
jgi:peptide methionine sulfoxide reductase msrA/msrB